jgi:hypothetical protein
VDGVRGEVPDNTIGTLAKFFRHRVSFVHDKVLIKDLEHLSAREICHYAWRSRRLYIAILSGSRMEVSDGRKVSKRGVSAKLCAYDG